MAITAAIPTRDTAAHLRTKLREVIDTAARMERLLGADFDAQPDDVRGRAMNGAEEMLGGLRTIAIAAGLVRAGGGDAR